MPEGNQFNGAVSPFLTGLAMGFIEDQGAYIADRVFNTIPVAAPAGTFPVWERGDFLRPGGKELANREAPPLVDFASGQGSYSTGHWGVGQGYTAKEVAQAALRGTSEAKLRRLITFNVTTKALIDREIKVAALCQTTGNWTTTYAGVASGPSAGQFVKWSAAGSTPVDDIKAAKKQVRNISGFWPNRLVISEDVKDVLLKNAQILALWQPTFVGGARPTVLNLAQLREVLEVEEIIVANAPINNTAEGATDVFTNIWSNTAFLYYATGTPDVELPSAGYNFVWNGDVTAGLPAGAAAPASGPQTWGSYKNERGLWIRESEIVRPQQRIIDVEKFDSPNVVAKDLGVTFTATI